MFRFGGADEEKDLMEQIDENVLPFADQTSSTRRCWRRRSNNRKFRTA